MSRLSVITTYHGIEIQIPSTFWEDTKVWVVISRSSNRYVDELRYRESEISLKKLPTNVCKIKIKNNPKVKGQMTAFLFVNGFGRTKPPMNSVMDTSWKPKSRNLSVNWRDMKIREKERQMGQFIRNSQVQSSDPNSEFIEGAISLTEIGSTSSGKEATRQDSSIVRIRVDIHVECGTRRRRARRSRNQTHSIFHTIKPMRYRRRRIF